MNRRPSPSDLGALEAIQVFSAFFRATAYGTIVVIIYLVGLSLALDRGTLQEPINYSAEFAGLLTAATLVYIIVFARVLIFGLPALLIARRLIRITHARLFALGALAGSVGGLIIADLLFGADMPNGRLSFDALTGLLPGLAVGLGAAVAWWQVARANMKGEHA